MELIEPTIKISDKKPHCLPRHQYKTLYPDKYCQRSTTILPKQYHSTSFAVLKYCKGSTGRAYTIINQYITTKANLKFHFTSKDVTLLKLKAYIFSFLQLPDKEP